MKQADNINITFTPLTSASPTFVSQKGTQHLCTMIDRERNWRKWATASTPDLFPCWFQANWVSQLSLRYTCELFDSSLRTDSSFQTFAFLVWCTKQNYLEAEKKVVGERRKTRKQNNQAGNEPSRTKTARHQFFFLLFSPTRIFRWAERKQCMVLLSLSMFYVVWVREPVRIVAKREEHAANFQSHREIAKTWKSSWKRVSTKE